ncbi:Zinc transport protein ZntB [Ralstonia psammae]|uniref:Zinc transport protein ZntB n=1 Tax=Ralstonia psammae TaxID=3058598 RepID=A0ABN9J1F6_9RALS|nr:transporter [Ralstonia sp. LMG 19083]CAJ0798970.1 Zinc transport protein ZntB [Ralstonia sp. LMG 19083]
MTATASAISFQSDNTGLICGFRFEPGKPGVALDSSEIADALEHAESEGADDAFIWLHFNLSRAGCMRWLQGHLDLPEPFLDMLGEEAHSTRIEQQDGALVAVFNDVIFDFERTPTQVATQWVYAHRRLLVTLRRKPLHSVDRLRECVRSGETFRSPADLLGHLMCDQADLMTQIVRTTGIDIDRIEDRFLASKITSGRQELAGTRRVLVRLQRMLAPEPGSVFRLLARPPAWLHPEDVQQLRESTEEFSVVLRDMSGLIERIKLLQEEVIARLDEQNNRTLFTLTLVTVLALPINIVAGLFGMNVGGVPLADNHHGFWLMVGLVAAFTMVIAWWVVRRRNNQ